MSASDDPASVVIDCEAVGRGFIFDGGENASAVLRSVTIRNGAAPKGGAYGGGGLLCIDSSPTFENCVVEQSTAFRSPAGASTDGGGAYIDGGHITFVDCLIHDNYSHDRGGGLYVVGGGGVTLLRCTLERNGANEDGGGLYSSVPVTLTDCVFRENGSNVGTGGGVICSGSSFLCSGTLFEGNRSDTGGDAVHLLADSISMVSCDVIGGFNGFSGSVLLSGGRQSAILDGCVFYGNASEAALEVDRKGVTQIRNCTIVGNGGVGAVFRTSAEVERSIVRGNCSDDIWVVQDASLSIACSAIDTAGVREDGEVTYTGPQVFDDPLFCGPESCADSPTTLGNYSLATGSPCLPTGSPCGETIGGRGEGCILLADLSVAAVLCAPDTTFWSGEDDSVAVGAVVGNDGLLPSAPSFVRVQVTGCIGFWGDTQPITALQPGDSDTAWVGPFPRGLMPCEVDVTVDFFDDVVEADEDNNVASGVTPCAVVDVDEEPSVGSVPLRLHVPNPWRIGGRITFSGAGAERLEIYDVAGRLVRSWDLGSQAGLISWDGLGATGQPVRPGRYFLQLVGASGTATRSLTILR